MIIAIIAVITVPIILNLIENSRKGAATDSAYGYKDAVGKYYLSRLSQDSDFILNGEYTINNTSSSTSLSLRDGKSYTATELQTVIPYEEVGLNMTIIDSTQKEYRYAFDSNNSLYLIKN